MVAIKNHEAERFIARDVGRYSAFLVYGTDVGLVSERVRRIVAALVDDPADPFQLVRIGSDDLGQDPGRLVDEVGTVPLFGGRRAVLVDGGAARKIEAAVGLALAMEGGCPVVIEAGALKGDAPLRKAVERAKTAAAIACFPDDERDLARLVEAEVAAAGLTIEPAARDLMVSLLGSDRLASRAEIGKLLLYAHGAGPVTDQHVVEAVADASALAGDDAVEAAFDGDLGTLDARLGRLHLGPVEAGLLLATALRHASALHRASIAGPADGATSRFGLNPRRKAAMERHAAVLDADMLARSVVRLGDAIGLARREPRLAVEHATRALWSVAQAARPRARRR